MKIKKTELQKALEIVRPGLAGKEMVEQSTSFAFLGDRVVTYNDEISISHPISNIEITGAIKAEELYSLLTKVKKENIEMETEENQIILNSGRMKAGIIFQAEIKLPIEEVPAPNKWKEIPEFFLDMLQMAVYNCGKDFSRPVLTCVYVGNDVIESTDNIKIFRAENIKSVVGNYLILASSAQSVIRIKPNKVSLSEGWVHFKNDNKTIISCRIFEDKFPDMSPHLSVKGVKIVLPISLINIIERAEVFAKRDHSLDEAILLTINENRIRVEATSDSGGWFNETVRVDYKKEEIKILIIPSFLREILKYTQTCTVNEDRAKFEGSGWIYITCLKRESK